jgi:Ca-activated chloride channel family protein
MKGVLHLCMLVLLVPATCCAATLHDTVKKGGDLYAQEKYDEALNAFVDGQIEQPEDARLKYNIASSKYMMKNYEEALKGYLDIAATARDARLEEKSLFNAGNTLYRQGKLEEAIEYYKKALALATEDKDAQQNLEFVREEIKRRMNEAKDTQKKQQEQEQKKDQNCKNPQQQDNQTQSAGQQQQQEKKDQEQEGQDQQQPQDQQKKESQPQDQQQAAAGNEKAPQDEKQQAAPDDAREMSKEEAQQWLNSVRENRDNLKEGKQRARAQGGARSGKDW